MDIQGLERLVLEKFFAGPDRAEVSSFLVGTHSDEIHAAVVDLLKSNGYAVEFECSRPPGQPDGIVLARFPGLSPGETAS
jgi:hypothetical protein